MDLTDRLKAIIEGMPQDGSVQFPVAFLSQLIEAEGAGPGVGRLLTLQEAGDIVGRSPGTLRTWANSGQFEGAFKLQNRSWRVPEKALQKFTASRRARATNHSESQVGRTRRLAESCAVRFRPVLSLLWRLGTYVLQKAKTPAQNRAG